MTHPIYAIFKAKTSSLAVQKLTLLIISCTNYMMFLSIFFNALITS